MAPAPGIELGMVRRPEANIRISTYHSEQEPYLLLSAVYASGIPAYKTIRHVITEPVFGSSQYLYVFRPQSNLLAQLAIHRLYGSLSVLDATLRKLPRMLPNTFRPENLISVVDEDNTDIGAIAITVKHSHTHGIQYN